MTNYPKSSVRLLALWLILVFFFSPVLPIVQLAQAETAPDDPFGIFTSPLTPPEITLPDGTTYNGNTSGSGDNGLGARDQKDNQAAQRDQQILIEQQQKEDMKACIAQVNGQAPTGNGSGIIDPEDPNTPHNPNDPNDPNNPNSPSNPRNLGKSVSPCSSSSGMTAAYIVANEGWVNNPYIDPTGHRVIGAAHLITGQEGFDVSNGITDAQARQLFYLDYNTARNGAMRSAQMHGVNWDTLSPERQTVLIDMAYAMGAEGSGGLNTFHNMWNNVRMGQQTGNQQYWTQAGYEITNSTYAGQVGNRAARNAQAMATNDSSGINQQIASSPQSRNFCGTAWLPITSKYLAGQFRDWTKQLAKILATTRAEAQTSVDISALLSLNGTQLANTLSSMSSNNLALLFSNANGSQLGILLNNLPTGSRTSILDKLPGNVLGVTLQNIGGDNAASILLSIGSRNAGVLLDNVPRDLLGPALRSINGGQMGTLMHGMNPDLAGRILFGMPREDLGSILTSLPTNITNSLLGGMNPSLVSGLMNFIPGNALGGLIQSLPTELVNNLIGKLPQEILGTVISALPIEALAPVLTNLPTEALTNLMLNPSINGAITTAIQMATPAIQAALQPAMTAVANALGPLATNVMGPLASVVPIPGLSALLGGGLYVPVVEQNGQLMTHTGNIDTTTKEIKSLQIQICTHLKAIRRIQSRMEMAQFAGDPQLDRIKATEIEKYRQALIGDQGVIRTGYTDANLQPAPLYVTNMDKYLGEQKAEAARLIIDDIKKSANPNKDAIARDLLAQNAYGLSFEPSLTAEELSALQGSGQQPSPTITGYNINNIPILSRIIKPIIKLASYIAGQPSWADDPPAEPTPQADLATFAKLLQPENNRYGSFMIANQQLERSQNVAEQNARDQYLASQGFLPTRKCKTMSDDGETCKEWEIVSPGSVVKESDVAAVNAKLNAYLQAQTSGQVAKGNQPDATEVAQNRPINPSQGGGAPGPTYTNPSSVVSTVERGQSSVNITPPSIPGQGTGGPVGSGGTGASTDSGWTPTDANTSFSSLIDVLDNLINGGDDPAEAVSSVTGPLSITDIIAGALSNLPPAIHFKNKSLGNNQHSIYWVVANAKSCVAGNNWRNINKNTYIKKKGDKIETTGALTITYPLDLVNASNTPINTIDYILQCKNDNGKKTATTTINR